MKIITRKPFVGLAEWMKYSDCCGWCSFNVPYTDFLLVTLKDKEIHS